MEVQAMPKQGRTGIERKHRRMSYEQAVKHWGNHRKDRFYQQCSGYASNGISQESRLAREKKEELSRKTMTEILRQNHIFPIYITQDKIGQWVVVPKNHISGAEIKDREELMSFALDFAEVGAEKRVKGNGYATALASGSENTAV